MAGQRCLFLLLCSLVLTAFVSPQEGTGKRYLREKMVVRPQLSGEQVSFTKGTHGQQTVVKRDRLSSVPRLISGTGLVDRRGLQAMTDLEVVSTFIADNETLLGITQEDMRIVKEATLRDDDVGFYKFDIFRDDIKIEDAALLFRFKHAKLVQVVNRTFSEARVRDASSTLSDRELREIVARELGTNNYTALGYAYRVVAEKDHYVLVKVRTFQQELGEHNTVQIDLATGKVFEVAPTKFYNKTLNAEPEPDPAGTIAGVVEAKVHPRWYRQDTEFDKLAEIAIKFFDSPQTPDDSPQENIEARGTVQSDARGSYRITRGMYPKLEGMKGLKVNIVNQTGAGINVAGVMNGNAWQTQVTDEGGRAEVSNDKTVAQSMVFYHTDYIFRLAAQYIETPWFDVPLESHTNLSRSCNAHWDTRKSTINFYSGNRSCANTGLISDIIYHEWGHGLDAKTGGIADGAFSEGFGDIMSLIITKSHILGIDFGLDGRSVRDLDPDKIYPQDSRGGVHAVGMIIGSTFWDMFNEFKKFYSEDEALHHLRNFAFKMIFTAEKYTDVYDVLLVIDDDDADLTNGTPNFCLINEPFAQHGLAETAQECLVLGFVRAEVQELQGNNNRIIEPAERIELTPFVENYTKKDLVDLRGQASSAQEFIVWENDVAEWQTVAKGAKVGSDKPFVFSVAPDTVCGSEFDITMNFEVGRRKKQFSEKFLVGRSAGEKALYQGVGLPAEIPDMREIEVAVAVEGEQWLPTTEVYEAHLKYAINHTYQGDLEVRLIAPNGEVIKIREYRGRGNGGIIFDEDITEKLAGKLGAGEWKLRVSDVRRRDGGVLNDFALTLMPKKFVCEQ